MSAVSTAIPIAQHAAPPAPHPAVLQLPSQPVPTYAHQPAFIVSVANVAPVQQPRPELDFATFAKDVQAAPIYTVAAVSQVAPVHQTGAVSWSVDTTERVSAVASVAATEGAAINGAAVADSAANARAAAIAARDGVGTVAPPVSTAPGIDDPTAPFVNVFA